uniref:Acyltransferase n=1 Tax=Globodera rostochiensis TaxID=31243 RepID=A0A914H1B0_GLORO
MSTGIHRSFSDRLKQTAGVLFYLGLLLLQPFILLAVVISFASSPIFWGFASLYMIWYISDFDAPRRGAHFNESVYKWPIWTHLANFFPIEVVKTAEIPPNRNYIFSAHPHGILGTSSTVLFGTNGLNFSGLFPGIKMHPVTLGLNFWIPFRREFILALRIISSDKEAIDYVLALPKDGNAVGMAPGGAAEALEAHPGSHRLILANRKGFVKLAIKHGASLVPVYHFGETDLFNQVNNSDGSLIRKIQHALKASKWPTFPLAYGQNELAAVLSDEWCAKLPVWLRRGLVPYRRRIVTIVGAPMDIEKDAAPSDALVSKVHAEYCRRLRELFNAHKVKHGGLSSDVQLEIV